MRHRLVIGLAALLMAAPASAEVADKEPSIGAMWALAVVCNLVAALLTRVRPWLGLLVVPFAALWSLIAVSELADPYVGLAIKEELGAAYVALSWLSIVLAILGPIAIVALSKAHRRQKR